MSQGSFSTAKYQTSETTPRILPIRLQPETVLEDNPEPAGGLTGSQRVKASKSNRNAYGIHARYMTLSRRIGDADGPFTGATIQATVVLLTPAAVASYPVGSTVTYGGLNDWEVSSHTPEKIK